MAPIADALSRHPRDALAVGALILGLVVLTAHWAPRSFWSPDALFYQANAVEFGGASEEEALDEVWTGPLSAPFRAADAARAPEAQVLADPEWIPYTSEFFERRAFVPLLAALGEPFFGLNSLEVISIIGVFVFALLLYALLRLRFSAVASALAVAACLAWPPLRWAFMPLTESWGLALMTLALMAAVLYVDRSDRRWLAVWAAAILVLGFTRDFTAVPVLAATGLLLAWRAAMPARALTVTAVVAALPAPLLLGAALREQLAYGFNGRMIPADDSWSFVLSNYPDAAEAALRSAGEYLFQTRPRFLEEAWPLWPFTLILIAGLIVLVVARVRSSSDPFVPLLRGGLVGAFVVMALNPVFTHYRYQLVLLPMAAAGLAMLTDEVRRRLGIGEKRSPATPTTSRAAAVATAPRAST